MPDAYIITYYAQNYAGVIMDPYIMQDYSDQLKINVL